jgi:hypothetical protein
MGLVKDALDPAMVLVGRTLLSTPQIASEASVRSYWQLSVGVADALLVLVVISAGALVMSHETLQTSYAVKDVIPRLTLAAIATNASTPGRSSRWHGGSQTAPATRPSNGGLTSSATGATHSPRAANTQSHSPHCAPPAAAGGTGPTQRVR